jgi:DNA-directed RNA polymerase alpha subunit
MSSIKEFSSKEAKIIGEKIGIDFSKYNLEEFRVGLSVELEHGSHDPETNVIKDDESLAGKIAWAHLKELPDYYTRLEKMEKEGEEFWASKNTA